MSLNADMLEFKPKLKKNLITYCREEKKGFYTIRFDSPFIGSEVVLNDTFVKIINALNGENSIKNIIHYLMKTYKDAVEDNVKKDVSEVLNMLFNAQGITWAGENPFINKFTKNIDKDCKVYLANYTDIEKISKLINVSKINSHNENEKYITYINPFNGKESINKDSILINMGSALNFIVEKNDEIVGSFSFGFSSAKINCLQYFIFDKVVGHISEYLNYAISIIQKDKFNNAKCFRAYLLNEDNFLLKEKLNEIGFTKTITLENELGKGTDVQEFNYYV